MYEFEFMRPATLSEAVEALKDEGAMALSGGQTLLPSMKSRLAAPDRLVALSALDELRGITSPAPGLVCIGAAMRHAEVAAALTSTYPALSRLAGGIGDPAVRNRGTIGGSLANNDPSACYPAAVLGSDSIIATDRREIACDAFFEGLFTTALEPGEVVTAVTFKVPRAAQYKKFRQIASGFALVGVFYARYDDHLRIAVTGADEDGVFRWSAAEEALETGGPEALDALAGPETPMLSDMHASADYRSAVVAEITRRCVREAEAR